MEPFLSAESSVSVRPQSSTHIDWLPSFSSPSRSSEQTTHEDKIQPTVDEQHLDSDNRGESSSWLGSITSALSSGIERIQENLLGKHETPNTSDHSSTANDQELPQDKQTNFTEKETNSQTTPLITDETFSSVRQSKQAGENERTTDVDSTVDNNNQISGRSTSSPTHEEEKPVQNNQPSPRSSIDIENKLSSATTIAETPQSISTSEKQIKAEDISDEKEEPVPSASSGTNETITSIDQQSSSDSLTDIVRQIGIRPHIADLSSRSSKADVTALSQEASVTAQQTHENIPQDQDAPLQSISKLAGVETLAAPVTDTVETEDYQKRPEDTLVIEHENAQKESRWVIWPLKSPTTSLSSSSEQTSTANVQRNETDSSGQVDERSSVKKTTDEVEADRLTTDALTGAVHEIIHTPLTGQASLPRSENDVPAGTETTTLEEQHLRSSSRHEAWATEVELERPPSREQGEGESMMKTLSSIVRQVPLLLTTDVEQPQESFQSTDTTEDETSSSRSVSLPLQSSQQQGVAVPAEHPLSTDLRTKEDLSEQSTQDQRETHPETGTTKQTVVYERSTATTKEETQPDITTDLSSTLLRESSIEDASRDEPRLQSSTFSITPVDNITSLTETVRQILATPVSIHLPSVDHSPTTTTQASPKPFTITDVTDEASPVLSSRSFITEITEETTGDDAKREAEAERLASEALSAAVRTLTVAPSASMNSPWDEQTVLSSAPDAARPQSPLHAEKQEEPSAVADSLITEVDQVLALPDSQEKSSDDFAGKSLAATQEEKKADINNSPNVTTSWKDTQSQSPSASETSTTEHDETASEQR